MLTNTITKRLEAVVFCGLAVLAGCDGEPVEVEPVDEHSFGPAESVNLEDPEATEDYAEFERTQDPLELTGPALSFEGDPDDVYIESISTGGTGCPNPYTVTPVISDDRKSFLLIFDEMVLEYPPGPRIQNKICSAGIKLHIPGGWQVALATVNIRGYAYLDKGIRARQTSKYFFAGNPISFAPHATLKGPFDDLYDFTDEVPFQSLVWSPCGGSAIFGIQSVLNLNALGNPHGYGIFSNDTIDGQFRQLFLLQWKKCS